MGCLQADCQTLAEAVLAEYVHQADTPSGPSTFGGRTFKLQVIDSFQISMQPIDEFFSNGYVKHTLTSKLLLRVL